MFHVVEDYCGALAVLVMGEKGWGGVIHLPTVWCFQSFDIFIAAHLLYFMVTSKSEFEGVCVGHCKCSLQPSALHLDLLIRGSVQTYCSSRITDLFPQFKVAAFGCMAYSQQKNFLVICYLIENLKESRLAQATLEYFQIQLTFRHMLGENCNSSEKSSVCCTQVWQVFKRQLCVCCTLRMCRFLKSILFCFQQSSQYWSQHLS